MPYDKQSFLQGLAAGLSLRGRPFRSVPDFVPVEIITGIQIAVPPDKINYHWWETLDFTGLRVEAIYNSGRTADITAECRFSPDDGTEIGFVETITHIRIARVPDKRNYKPSETLDFTGLRVEAVYTNGRTEDVTSMCTFSPGEGTAV